MRPMLKRLPPYRRRQLQHSIWLISMRLRVVEGALKDTPDGNTETFSEERAAYKILSARIMLDEAESLLLADDDGGGMGFTDKGKTIARAHGIRVWGDEEGGAL